MLGGLLFLFTSQDLPTLADVNARVQRLPGVELRSEMVRPSVVPVTFKISPRGLQWAKYPTTEQFTSRTADVVWMPDRREFATNKPEETNPLPVGFHTLWPVSRDAYRQIGPTSEATFHGFQCYVLPCKGEADYTIQLFVNKDNLLPRGTRVELSGTTYEMVHRTVLPREMDDRFLQFRPPADARPAGKHDPAASLIKPGTKLKRFQAKDAAGQEWSLQSLLRQRQGAVLNFWFSSCTGCVAEMPFLVKLAPELARRQIALLGVNAIDEGSIVQRTAKTNGLPYPTLVGPGASALSKSVGVQAYPVTLVLDKGGTVIDTILGFDEPRLRSALNRL